MPTWELAAGILMKMENCTLTATGNILSQAATFKLNGVSNHSAQIHTNQSGPICRRNSSFSLMVFQQEHGQDQLPRARTRFITGCFQTLQAEGGGGRSSPSCLG